MLGVKLKRRWYVFWPLFKVDLCSATSMESSRRDLFNDMAEHGAILKNDQNTHHSFIFNIVDLCLATSMGSSRRDLLSDMAEHRSIL